MLYIYYLYIVAFVIILYDFRYKGDCPETKNRACPDTETKIKIKITVLRVAESPTNNQFCFGEF